DGRTATGDTPLGLAVEAAQIDTLIALLDAGADPNRPGGGGLPPVALAAASGQAGALHVLLSRGGAPDSREEETGNTALMLAANRARLEEVRLLLEAGADVSLRARDGWTALAAAEMIGDDEIAALLRQAGARE
ncbi:MAG TPA: ankyrin repeat domain-containing protein, partial [Kiloniellaceae bacterium]|nr:ankyrin repeat domain-containing protein [Kiloniellaceae bacterium]